MTPDATAHLHNRLYQLGNALLNAWFKPQNNLVAGGGRHAPSGVTFSISHAILHAWYVWPSARCPSSMDFLCVLHCNFKLGLPWQQLLCHSCTAQQTPLLMLHPHRLPVCQELQEPAAACSSMANAALEQAVENWC